MLIIHEFLIFSPEYLMEKPMGTAACLASEDQGGLVILFEFEIDNVILIGLIAFDRKAVSDLIST